MLLSSVKLGSNIPHKIARCNCIEPKGVVCATLSLHQHEHTARLALEVALQNDVSSFLVSFKTLMRRQKYRTSVPGISYSKRSLQSSFVSPN